MRDPTHYHHSSTLPQEAGGRAVTAALVKRRYWIGLLAVALLYADLGSGLYVVNADEHAVVRRFGAIAAHLGPGLHYRLPWPVDRVDVVKTTSVMKIGVGFRLPENASDTLEGVELLTGDTNSLTIALVVQYVIRDPADYLFAIDRPRAGQWQRTAWRSGHRFRGRARAGQLAGGNALRGVCLAREASGGVRRTLHDGMQRAATG